MHWPGKRCYTDTSLYSLNHIFSFFFFYNTTTGSVEKYLLVTGYAVPECSPDWLFSKVKLAKLPHSESHNATMKGSLEEIGDKVMQMCLSYSAQCAQHYCNWKKRIQLTVICNLLGSSCDILHTEPLVCKFKCDGAAEQTIFGSEGWHWFTFDWVVNPFEGYLRHWSL